MQLGVPISLPLSKLRLPIFRLPVLVLQKMLLLNTALLSFLGLLLQFLQASNSFCLESFSLRPLLHIGKDLTLDQGFIWVSKKNLPF